MSFISERESEEWLPYRDLGLRLREFLPSIQMRERKQRVNEGKPAVWR
jgi:hypothetical protein